MASMKFKKEKKKKKKAIFVHGLKRYVCGFQKLLQEIKINL